MGDIIMRAVGYVRNRVCDKKDAAWGGDLSTIILENEYHTGLKGLENFSHALVVFYLDQAKYERETHLQRRPRDRDDMPMVGIFSQRTKDRPNNIGVTAVQIVSADDATLTVKGLDAIDGTPVLDIKPYYPVFDKKDAHVPEWVDRLMEHYF